MDLLQLLCAYFYPVNINPESQNKSNSKQIQQKCEFVMCVTSFCLCHFTQKILFPPPALYSPEAS